ncbi:hypothetical protein ACSS6W_005186 [Trichoderma asperelloides]|uniref:Helix-turn-helix domain-containing protein n=1 Tax=Trichoderma asperellum TaxID=101201 RepID=A0A6V8R4Y9_TRIAP|nr:hypothetical protein LI328DRAFT_147148 [Trichoderma asperelloides]GFP59949.1 hypothetical protein TASIC1_0015011800 [Trichoderma asperellum]
MGASSSKAAARGAARKYPTRSPGAVPQATTKRARPQQPAPRGDGSKDDAIRADAMDPDFAPGDFSKRLHQMGIVNPNPTFSPSSTAAPNFSPESLAVPPGPLFPPAKQNTTLSALEARRRLERIADEDLEIMGREGGRRRLADMRTILDAVQLLNHGTPVADIEKRLRVTPGFLNKLGPAGVLTHIPAN